MAFDVKNFGFKRRNDSAEMLKTVQSVLLT